jgi:ATP synthase protein I
MSEPSPNFRRTDVQDRTRRDFDRWRRRENGTPFWRSLALIGSVGWPIVLLATGGALLGSYLDTRLGTGIRFTLVLLTAGTAVGTFTAFRTVRREEG